MRAVCALMECRTLGIHISEIFAQFTFLIERHHILAFIPRAANIALMYKREAIAHGMIIVGTELVWIILTESNGSNLDE